MQPINDFDPQLKKSPAGPDLMPWYEVVHMQIKNQNSQTNSTYWVWKSKTLQSAVLSLSTFGFFS